ncbi:3-methyladenine DNA glycosylase [Corynebacterium atrinae]|uniref:DNA-3-methyladenine glycosylase n=1 Tax=Corynebacterium atrinae TaxID=1336740 RepID=UPI0025B44B8B|nr:DNA-3-methyladenine glycosylase [Corynebacterium atrinae]WJY62235.1 3-methyladenine DNA glycosylase [Corynebacterium atrinae]
MIDFSAPADVVAPQLLGATIHIHGVGVRLTEVEAYLGSEDEAAHTYRGQTPRNAAMFGPPGRLYVYLSYGIHRAGNLVCAPVGTGQGCLLRAGEVTSGVSLAQERRGEVPFHRLAQGPGNLGRALGLNLSDNGAQPEITESPEEVEWVRGPRIGITKNTDAPLRFWIPGHATVSGRRHRPPA